MKNEILFIHTHILDGASGGSQRTIQAFSGLKEFFNVIEYSCYKPANKIKGFFRNLFMFAGMMTSKDCKEILHQIEKRNLKYVFFDTSLHGKVVRKIKDKFPYCKVIVNYHNSEKKYYYDMFLQKGLLYYLVYIAAKYNENLSNKYADMNVFISKEDIADMQSIKNEIVIPVTLKDTYKYLEATKEPYIVFLGSAFFANFEAANFIINEIAPNVTIKCIIAGKGMKTAFPQNYKNVEVFDYVESLVDLFSNATAFISPIFSGSGAKIKIAEALMHGKRIIGTEESFFGYDTEEMDYTVCKTANDFIEAINSINSENRFSERNRNLFQSRYDERNNIRYYEQVYKFCQSGNI